MQHKIIVILWQASDFDPESYATRRSFSEAGMLAEAPFLFRLVSALKNCSRRREKSAAFSKVLAKSIFIKNSKWF